MELGIILGVSVFGLVVAGMLAKWVLAQDQGPESMQKVSRAIKAGAEAFLEVARGLGTADEVAGTTHAVLTGIALGAVFMGAMTYIGNGPNFMVRAIAEGQGLKMPSFFGYMLWSVGILAPLFFTASLFLF